MALARRFRSIFGARSAGFAALEGGSASGLGSAATRPDQPLSNAEGTDSAVPKEAAHEQERSRVASGAEMVVTHRLPLGSSGTNHAVIEDALLANGACTVELGKIAAFTSAHHYQVFVTPQSGAATYHVVRHSGSSFTIRSSNEEDGAIVSFLAIGD